MFYSTEILSDKRYALSTVWRAGNTAPGARSTGLRRKAVFEVNVERTCGTIKEPPGAPIALRLQGTLLYGTARIYQEQCRFVLSDSERIQRALLRLCGSVLDDKLDSNAGKTRNAQIMVPNDPSFDLDLLQLPPFEFDAPEGGSFLSQSRQASWTNMSLQSRSSNGSQLPPQLVLDADSSGGRASFVGSFGYSASNASVLQDTPLAQRASFGFADDDNLLVDVGLFIDENGNIVEQEPPSEPQLPAFPAAALQQATKGRQPGAHGGDAAAEDDALVPMIVDDDGVLVHPSAAVVAAAAGKPRVDETTSSSSFSPSTVAESPRKTAKQAVQLQRPRHKTNFVDEITQIPLSDYFRCVTHYTQNMERALESRDRARVARRANDPAVSRKAAYDVTFGRGLFGIALALKTGHVVYDQQANGAEAASGTAHALVQMFAGDALAETLYGENFVQAKRRKLAADAAAAAAAAAAPSTPVGRHGMAGVFGFDGDEDELEIERGRQPGSALSDNPSLALRGPPSSVAGSVQQPPSAGTNRGAGGIPSSAGGPSSPGFLERYSDDSIGGLDFHPLPGQADGPFFSPLRSAAAAGGGSGSQKDGYNSNSNSQLGEEMRNTTRFLGLLRQKAETDGIVRGGPAAAAAADTCRWVAFADVVAPFRQDRPAVVGAFMSLLTLATAHALRIGAPADKADVSRLDREILIGVPAATEAAATTGTGKKGKTSGRRTGRKRAFHEMVTASERTSSVAADGGDGAAMEVDG